MFTCSLNKPHIYLFYLFLWLYLNIGWLYDRCVYGKFILFTLHMYGPLYVV